MTNTKIRKQSPPSIFPTENYAREWINCRLSMLSPDFTILLSSGFLSGGALITNNDQTSCQPPVSLNHDNWPIRLILSAHQRLSFKVAIYCKRADNIINTKLSYNMVKDIWLILEPSRNAPEPWILSVQHEIV